LWLIKLLACKEDLEENLQVHSESPDIRFLRQTFQRGGISEILRLGRAGWSELSCSSLVKERSCSAVTDLHLEAVDNGGASSPSWSLFLLRKTAGSA